MYKGRKKTYRLTKRKGKNKVYKRKRLTNKRDHRSKLKKKIRGGGGKSKKRQSDIEISNNVVKSIFKIETNKQWPGDLMTKKNIFQKSESEKKLSDWSKLWKKGNNGEELVRNAINEYIPNNVKDIQNKMINISSLQLKKLNDNPGIKELNQKKILFKEAKLNLIGKDKTHKQQGSLYNYQFSFLKKRAEIELTLYNDSLKELKKNIDASNIKIEYNNQKLLYINILEKLIDNANQLVNRKENGTWNKQDLQKEELIDILINWYFTIEIMIININIDIIRNKLKTGNEGNLTKWYDLIEEKIIDYLKYEEEPIVWDDQGDNNYHINASDWITKNTNLLKRKSLSYLIDIKRLSNKYQTITKLIGTLEYDINEGIPNSTKLEHGIGLLYRSGKLYRSDKLTNIDEEAEVSSEEISKGSWVPPQNRMKEGKSNKVKWGNTYVSRIKSSDQNYTDKNTVILTVDKENSKGGLRKGYELKQGLKSNKHFSVTFGDYIDPLASKYFPNSIIDIPKESLQADVIPVKVPGSGNDAKSLFISDRLKNEVINKGVHSNEQFLHHSTIIENDWENLNKKQGNYIIKEDDKIGEETRVLINNGKDIVGVITTLPKGSKPGDSIYIIDKELKKWIDNEKEEWEGFNKSMEKAKLNQDKHMVKQLESIKMDQVNFNKQELQQKKIYDMIKNINMNTINYTTIKEITEGIKEMNINDNISNTFINRCRLFIIDKIDQGIPENDKFLEKPFELLRIATLVGYSISYKSLNDSFNDFIQYKALQLPKNDNNIRINNNSILISKDSLIDFFNKGEWENRTVHIDSKIENIYKSIDYIIQKITGDKQDHITLDQLKEILLWINNNQSDIQPPEGQDKLFSFVKDMDTFIKKEYLSLIIRNKFYNINSKETTIHINKLIQNSKGINHFNILEAIYILLDKFTLDQLKDILQRNIHTNHNAEIALARLKIVKNMSNSGMINWTTQRAKYKQISNYIKQSSKIDETTGEEESGSRSYIQIINTFDKQFFKSLDILPNNQAQNKTLWQTGGKFLDTDIISLQILLSTINMEKSKIININEPWVIDIVSLEIYFQIRSYIIRIVENIINNYKERITNMVLNNNYDELNIINSFIKNIKNVLSNDAWKDGYFYAQFEGEYIPQLIYDLIDIDIVHAFNPPEGTMTNNDTITKLDEDWNIKVRNNNVYYYYNTIDNISSYFHPITLEYTINIALEDIIKLIEDITILNKRNKVSTILGINIAFISYNNIGVINDILKKYEYYIKDFSNEIKEGIKQTISTLMNKWNWRGLEEITMYIDAAVPSHHNRGRTPPNIIQWIGKALTSLLNEGENIDLDIINKQIKELRDQYTDRLLFSDSLFRLANELYKKNRLDGVPIYLYNKLQTLDKEKTELLHKDISSGEKGDIIDRINNEVIYIIYLLKCFNYMDEYISRKVYEISVNFTEYIKKQKSIKKKQRLNQLDSTKRDIKESSIKTTINQPPRSAWEKI